MLEKEVRSRVDIGRADADRLTFKTAEEILLDRLAGDNTITPWTREYWCQRLVTLEKTWPGIEGLWIAKATEHQVSEWARKMRDLVLRLKATPRMPG